MPRRCIDEPYFESSSCYKWAPGCTSTMADVKAEQGGQGCVGHIEHSTALWLAVKPQAHSLALYQCWVLCPLLCPAMAVLFVPFAQYIEKCFFPKIMKTCPSHNFKFSLPRRDQLMPFLPLFSLLLDWLLYQPQSIASTLPLLILGALTCQVDRRALLNGLLYQHTRKISPFFYILSLASCGSCYSWLDWVSWSSLLAGIKLITSDPER